MQVIKKGIEMGYESRIYIVKKHPRLPIDGDKSYAEVIATFELRKCSPINEFIAGCLPATNCYIYADDGNTPILEDCYGEPLKEISVDEMIRMIDNVRLNYLPFSGYTTMQMLRAALDEMIKHDTVYDKVCLHYGH